MQVRMKNPVFVFPAALQGMLTVNSAATVDGLPAVTAKLVHLRASQINGCGRCVDMHAAELKKAGESDRRIWSVAAWRESHVFTPAERAALALTEAATRMADKPDAVPDDVWNEAARFYDEKPLAALILQIAMINAWNRINVVIRQPAEG